MKGAVFDLDLETGPTGRMGKLKPQTETRKEKRHKHNIGREI